MTVTITADAGTLDVTPQGWSEPQTPVQAAALEVIGAVISLPAGGNADDHPYALVLDPDAAQDWLGLVYGRQVAQACRELRHGQAREVPAEVSDTTRALTDLARACWVERWWPSATASLPGADQAALDLDRGLLAARAGRCLEAEPLAWLAGGIRGLGRLISLVAELTGARRERADRLLRESVAAAAYLLDPDTTEAQAAAAYQDHWDAEDAEVAQLLASWPNDEPIEAEPALMAGGDGPDEARYQTVDWLQVPARSVSGNEDNVVITTTDSGLTISVEAGDQPVPRLHARLFGDEPLPTVVRLEHQPGHRRYQATTTAACSRLDIADLRRPPSEVFPPRPDPVAYQDRRLVRAVLRRRLDSQAARPLLAELLAAADAGLPAW